MKSNSVLLISLLMCIAPVPALAQASLEDLKTSYSQARADISIHMATAKDLAAKGDAAGACGAWRAAVVSLNRKADSLHQIVNAVKDEPLLTAAEKQSISNEETMTREDIGSLETHIRRVCDAAWASSSLSEGSDSAQDSNLSDLVTQIKSVDTTGHQHMTNASDAANANDVAKGCKEVSLAIADYQVKYDLLTKLKAALESDRRAKPEMIADIGDVLGRAEAVIKSLKQTQSENCQNQ